jgi:outer membrane protein
MKRLLVVVLLAYCFHDTQAQTVVTAPARVLTFEEAIQIAIRNNILLNQQRNNLELSLAQKQAAIASIGPNVSLNGTAVRNNGHSFNQQRGEVVNGIRDNVFGSIDASINLFNGLSTFNNIRQTSAALDAQSYFVKRTQQDVMNTVSNQYLRVLLDIELLKIARENHEAQVKLLEQIQEQHRLGARSPVDEYNQDALTKGAEYQVVLAEIVLDNDKAFLAQTLLIDALEPFDVVKPRWDANTVGSEDPNVDTLVVVAKQQRADYHRAVKLGQSARYATAVSYRNMLPSLGAFASIGSSYNYEHGLPDSVDAEVNKPFNEQFGTNNFYKQFGVQLQIPIFQGLRSRATSVQARVAEKNAELILSNMELQIRNDVLRAVKNFQGSKKAYLVSVDQLTAAQNAYGLETERFNLGVTNFVDYTNANRMLVLAQTSAAQAEYNLAFQRILLAYAVGTLVPEDIVGQ